MKAAVLEGYESDLVVQEVSDPQLSGAEDVIVRIGAAGLCRTDLHIRDGLLRGVLGDLQFPYVLGHENTGWIQEVGSGVHNLSVGDPVILHPLITCGVCLPCRRADDMRCEDSAFPGQRTVWGGFAELLRTSARAVVRLPKGVDPTGLAAYADAGVAAYHAVKKVVPIIRPGDAVGVVGVGGVGQFVVQLLKLMSPARVVAIDIGETQRAFAIDVGADVATSPEQLPGEAEALAQAKGFRAVVDCVADGPTPRMSLNSLASGGYYSIIGAGGRVEADTLEMLAKEITVLGNLVGTYTDLVELLAFQDQIKTQNTYYALGDIGSAVGALERGELVGRAVIRP